MFYVLQPLHSTTKENIITKSMSRGRAHASHSFQSTARFTLMRTPAVASYEYSTLSVRFPFDLADGLIGCPEIPSHLAETNYRLLTIERSGSLLSIVRKVARLIISFIYIFLFIVDDSRVENFKNNFSLS